MGKKTGLETTAKCPSLLKSFQVLALKAPQPVSPQSWEIGGPRRVGQSPRERLQCARGREAEGVVLVDWLEVPGRSWAGLCCSFEGGRPSEGVKWRGVRRAEQ